MKKVIILNGSDRQADNILSERPIPILDRKLDEIGENN